MSKIIPMTTTTRGERSALDEFLPEVTFTSQPAVDASALLDPADVRLDPIGPRTDPTLALRKTDTGSVQSDVQMWPMAAAACVALGVSLLALALFARIGHF